MKKIAILLALLLVLPSIFAIDLSVEQTSSDELMIIGVDEPTVFNLKITNNDLSDNFLFYTFFGGESTPTETIPITNGQTKEIEFTVKPRSDLSQGGVVIFDLFVQGQDGTEQAIPLTINIKSLEDLFIIGSEEFDPESNSLEIYIKNTVNKNFENMQTTFKSPFFEREETISLIPYEKKNFNIQLNSEEFAEIVAGFYTLNAKVIFKDYEANIEGTIKFSEKDILETTEKKQGFMIRTNTITKENKGNTISNSEIILKKNIITRVFTTLNPTPDIIERKGLVIYYTWNAQVNPGETLEVVVTTNWFFPLIAIFLIVAIVVLTKKFSKTDLVLKKRVSFVKAKGGEFALKVSINLNSKKYVEKINLIDRLPPLVKVHERFGAEQPTRVDEATKRIEWNFEKLEPGEIRTVSYIIYSKIGVLGKFALPTATAIYEKEGNIQEAKSNKTFFIAEQLHEPQIKNSESDMGN
jgi:hypothetical protein